MEHAPTHRSLVLVPALPRDIQGSSVLHVDAQANAIDVSAREEVVREQAKRFGGRSLAPVVLAEQPIADLQLVHVHHSLEVHDLADDLAGLVLHQQAPEVLAPEAGVLVLLPVCGLGHDAERPVVPAAVQVEVKLAQPVEIGFADGAQRNVFAF